jgi:hypothetical protein
VVRFFKRRRVVYWDLGEKAQLPTTMTPLTREACHLLAGKWALAGGGRNDQRRENRRRLCILSRLILAFSSRRESGSRFRAARVKPWRFGLALSIERTNAMSIDLNYEGLKRFKGEASMRRGSSIRFLRQFFFFSIKSAI